MTDEEAIRSRLAAAHDEFLEESADTQERRDAANAALLAGDHSVEAQLEVVRAQMDALVNVVNYQRAQLDALSEFVEFTGPPEPPDETPRLRSVSG